MAREPFWPAQLTVAAALALYLTLPHRLAITIWLTNVLVFALWYWELDRGGPGRRSASSGGGAFRFPQQQAQAVAWTPGFVDYLYLSFTNATALSPTDTVPLSAWAKLLMMLQALISLLTLVLVAAHAVNVLG
jgi:uncharacterized membrane protein